MLGKMVLLVVSLVVVRDSCKGLVEAQTTEHPLRSLAPTVCVQVCVLLQTCLAGFAVAEGKLNSRSGTLGTRHAAQLASCLKVTQTSNCVT